jgi:hypothetical protein
MTSYLELRSKIANHNKGTKTPAANSNFKKLAVQWFSQALYPLSSFLMAYRLVLRNRQLLLAAKRYLSK